METERLPRKARRGARATGPRRRNCMVARLRVDSPLRVNNSGANSVIRRDIIFEHFPCASHQFPVVFVGCAAIQADLVIAAAGMDARPDKPVRARSAQKLPYQIQCITWLRLFHMVSQREKNGLC